MGLSTNSVYFAKVQICDGVYVIGHGYEVYPTLKPRVFLDVHGTRYDLPYTIKYHDYLVSLKLTLRNWQIYWNDIRLCSYSKFRPKAVNAAWVKVRTTTC